MISTKERKEKVKNSHYWGIDTKLLVEKKSQDTHIVLVQRELEFSMF